MKSPNNGGDIAPTRHINPPSKTSSAGNSLQFVESLAKRAH